MALQRRTRPNPDRPVPKKLPAKLANEPLLDAVCELRLGAAVDLQNVIPGALFTKLDGITSIEQTPASNIPAELRAQIPTLLDAPLVRLHWDHYSILCGRKSVAVASKLPYVGWKSFKPQICAIFRHVLELKVVTSVERYSVKYVNLVEGQDVNEQLKLLDWSLKVGEQDVRSGPVQLRCEMAGPEGMVTVLQIMAGGMVQLPDTSSTKYGAVVDADTVKICQTADIDAFKCELESRLEAIRLENKKWVFESLKQSTIDAMGPSYE